MIKKVFILLPIVLFYNLQGQVNITFNLDMKSLIEKNLFSPENGESIFIRGNFNQWNGFDYELKSINNNGSYRSSFTINSNIGDTLQYKFIIKKLDGRIYWERNPNPSNVNYGNRILNIDKNDLIVPQTKFDYDEFFTFPVIFTKEKLQQDFIQMRKAVERTHPALYDYTSKRQLDLMFEHASIDLNANLDLRDFYKSVSYVLSHIGCGHTKFWIPADYWNTAPPAYFPLRIQFIDNKVYLRESFTDSNDIPIGSEILSINEVPIQTIVAELKSIESSDGFIDAFKSKSIEKNFSKKYALYYGFPEIFKISFIPPGKILASENSLFPVDFETINKKTARGSELTLKLIKESNAAILTINSFIYYDRLELFRSFIDSAFEVIQNKNIYNLILDLRGNDGGDPFCSSNLLSYIEPEAVPYFAEPYDKYIELAKPIPKAKNNYRGNLYTLINGSVFSTTGHFCALLKYHKISKLVGSETGATFTCTGSVDYINLENTKLILGIAKKQRYSVAVNNMDPTRGVLPDYQIEQSQNDLIKGKDTVLDSVIHLISLKD